MARKKEKITILFLKKNKKKPSFQEIIEIFIIGKEE
jgi:hypothetical protein